MADILVVTDKPLIAMDLWDMLEGDGHAVRHVTSGQSALAALERKLPDLVVVDHAMPSPAGGTFAAAMRRDPRWRAIPVVEVGRAAAAASSDMAPRLGRIHRASYQVALLNSVAKLLGPVPRGQVICA
jgi:CheY-like chemotaxis protein